jgi:hypothetical protein
MEQGCVYMYALKYVSGLETETSSINWAQLVRFHLKTDTESSLRNVVFLNNRQDDG